MQLHTHKKGLVARRACGLRIFVTIKKSRVANIHHHKKRGGCRIYVTIKREGGPVASKVHIIERVCLSLDDVEWADSFVATTEL